MLKLYQISSARGSEHKVARTENKRGRKAERINSAAAGVVSRRYL